MSVALQSLLSHVLRIVAILKPYGQQPVGGIGGVSDNKAP